MDHCPDCGAPVNGREACQALWDEISIRVYLDLSYGRTHDLGFDAFCMQHPRYTRSAKSYAAHLTRLCCGLEFNASPAVYRAIRTWLNAKVEMQKPDAPESVGSVTVADVSAAQDAEEHHRRIQTWAENVWAAYASQHELARSWIQQALTQKSRS